MFPKTKGNPEFLDSLTGFEHAKGEYNIQIEARFESSHYLYKYFRDGSDEPNHGHSWRVFVIIERNDRGIADDGISIDFLSIRERLDMLIERIDHICINDLSEFKGINPTSENIARWFYAGLKNVVKLVCGRIISIKIYEGPSNVAEYKPLVT